MSSAKRLDKSPFPSDKPKKDQIVDFKKNGVKLEIMVNPVEAFKFRTDRSVLFSDVWTEPGIYADIKKGLRASRADIEKATGKTDEEEAAMEIVLHGDIPKPMDMREAEREQKRRLLINLIHRNAVDPATHRPHPPQRIENALAEARVKFDDHKDAIALLPEVIKLLRPILPIKFETKEVAIKIPAKYAGKSHNVLNKFGKPLRDDYMQDGSRVVVMDIPGGLEEELHSDVNALTHGEAETKILKIK